MTQQQYIINRKLNVLELGQTLGNISEACRKLGISRQHYYDIKQAIKALRLKLLEKWAAENTEVLTESQVQALEAAKEEKETYGEVESPHPGFLLAQDTCY